MNRFPTPKSSINREIFQSSALLALIVVALFGFFLSSILYYSEISKARAIINRTNHAVFLFIEGYFTEIINTITMLDENKEVRDAITLGKEARQRTMATQLTYHLCHQITDEEGAIGSKPLLKYSCLGNKLLPGGYPLHPKPA